jgi:uncharacterized cupredoxin-like copper-binding protein
LIVALVLMVIAAGFYAYRVAQKQSGSVIPYGSPSPSVSASTTATPVATPVAESSACATGELSASISYSGGAAGTSYYYLALKNVGSKTCTENGYPGVSLEDSSGTMLGQPAARDSAVAVQTFNLAPGKSAYARVEFPNPGAFEPGQCSANAASMQVFPPNQTKSLQVGSSLPYCPGFSATALSLQQQ